MALNRMGKNYDYSRYLAGLDGVAAGYGEEHNALVYAKNSACNDSVGR